MTIENIGAVMRAYRKFNRLEVSDVKQIFLDKYNLTVSEKTIYNWESSQYNLSLPKFLALCEIYHIKDISASPLDEEELSEELNITAKELSLIAAYRKHKDLQPDIDRMLLDSENS